MAQNTEPFHAIADQYEVVGRVLFIQVNPSGDVNELVLLYE